MAVLPKPADRARVTLQNRMSPFGVLEADPARGTMMGNRGCLVSSEGDLVRRWQVERWITCVLEFKGRRRHPLMQPGLYTELFFLDEATACATGHRPCHECRRRVAEDFLAAWRGLHRRDTRFTQVDARLHHERTRGAYRLTACAELPEGVMISLDGRAWVVVDGALRAWTPAGYAHHRALPAEGVSVLTPPSMVAAMRAGWRPALHPSADQVRSSSQSQRGIAAPAGAAASLAE
jgi:hypothetical protein